MNPRTVFAAVFFGSVLSFVALTVVHVGPGECSREALALVELRDARAERDAAVEREAATAQRAEQLAREVRLAHQRQIIEPRAPLVLPEPEMVAPLVLAIPDERPPDELQFMDADIAAAFSGCIYPTGTPTQVQLARELRRFREESFFVRDATVRCPCATLTRTGDIRPCPGCGGESLWVLAIRAIVAPRASRGGTAR